MKSRIERSFVDAKRIGGQILDGAGDSIAVQGSPAAKDGEDEKIKGGLRGGHILSELG
jgi:hypothetical protein